MKVNLQFIADQAKVSKALASRILNNKYVRVSEEKRKLVLDIAAKYNYQSNQIAASLRTQSTNTIALILPTLYFDFFGQLASTIETNARQKGLNVLICNSEEDLEVERHYLNMYRTGVIDGVLISPSDNTANVDLIQDMNSEGFPLVFVDRYIPHLPNSFVVTDGALGSRMLTESLLSKGHERIHFLSHTKSPDTSVQIDRYRGYRDSMVHSGFTPHRMWIPGDFETAKRQLIGVLTEKPAPTALVIVTTWDIKPLLHACFELQRKIPEDIEVAAFDRFLVPYTSRRDMEVAQNVHSPIMIVDQNPRSMGEKAFSALYSEMSNSKAEKTHCYLKPDLVSQEVLVK